MELVQAHSLPPARKAQNAGVKARAYWARKCMTTAIAYDFSRTSFTKKALNSMP